MRYLVALLSIVALMAFVGSAGAFTGCEIMYGIYAGATAKGSEGDPYYLYAIPDEYVPSIDGKLEDWAWAPRGMSFTLEDSPRPRCAEGPGVIWAKDDFDAIMYLGWVPATNSLAFAVHKVDDILYAPEEAITACWKEDNQQWCTDPSGVGGNFRKDQNCNTAQQNYYTPKQGGHIGHFGPVEYEWEFEAPYGFLGQTVDEATGSYDMELMIKLWDWLDVSPDASTEHTFEPYQLIGLTFLVVDVDSEEDWAATGWHCADPWTDASNFTAQMVLPVSETYERMVAVEPTTWGAVKAMFK